MHYWHFSTLLSGRSVYIIFTSSFTHTHTHTHTHTQHVFIPVLPGALIDFCCSPLPYLMGMSPTLIPALDEMDTMEEVRLATPSNT